MSARPRTAALLLIAALSLIAALLPLSAAAQPDPGVHPRAWKRALLGHHLPLAPAEDDARRRADTVGAFDLLAVRIGVELDGVRLPAFLRFEVTIESRQRLEDGFTLLAAFYEPLEVREQGGERLGFAHSPDTGELVVFLDAPLPAGRTRTYVIEAALAYTCDMPPSCADDRFLHLVEAAWYPMSYEYPVDDRFQITLDLDAPSSGGLAGTGVRVGPPSTAGGRTRASFRTERATILPAFAYGPYAIDAFGVVEIFAPARNALPDATAELAELAERTIEVYGALFGRYPFGRLGIAAIDTEAGAGIGPQANILLPDVFWQIPLDDPDLGPVLREVTTHEIGHQYFFNLLGVIDDGEAWMSEGFAEYAATRMSEAVTGTRDHARVNYWSYVLGADPASDRPLWGPGVGGHPNYFTLVYEKGSAALHALRFRVGSERWDAALRAWVNGYAGQIVTTLEFEDHLAEALGIDVSTFFDQWIYGAGVAELVVRTTRGRTERAPVIVDVQQPGRGPTFTGPLPLRLHAADGSARDVVIPLDAPPTEVDLGEAQWIEVDPDLTLFRRVRPDPAGDVNLDGVVDGMDLLDVRHARGRRAVVDGPQGRVPDPAWDDRLDVTRDDRVDDADADRVVEQYGAGW